MWCDSAVEHLRKYLPCMTGVQYMGNKIVVGLLATLAVQQLLLISQVCRCMFVVFLLVVFSVSVTAVLEVGWILFWVITHL